jgi:hypothetical protein
MLMMAPPGADPPGGLPGDDERAADVWAQHPIQVGEIEGRDRPEGHGPGHVHQDVDAAEGGLDRVEGRAHVLLIGDIAPDGDRGTTGLGDRRDGLVGTGPVARIVHGHGHAVACEPFGHDTPDGARASGDERDAAGADVAHGVSQWAYAEMNSQYI